MVSPGETAALFWQSAFGGAGVTGATARFCADANWVLLIKAIASVTATVLALMAASLCRLDNKRGAACRRSFFVSAHDKVLLLRTLKFPDMPHSRRAPWHRFRKSSLRLSAVVPTSQ